MNAERLHAKEVAEERLLRAIDRLEAAERRLEAARKASREAQEEEHLACVDWKNTQADWKRAESRFEEACTAYFTEASDRALQPVPGGSGGQLRSEENP